MFGRACANQETGDFLRRCEIGSYLGQREELDRFIKQRYIWVSRITMGSRSNDLGQLAQRFVVEHLRSNLGIAEIEIRPNSTIPGVTHTDRQTNRPTTFDIVVSKESRYVAVEISFQVTTNSVIERKAGQSQARFSQIDRAGHKIAYVLDGIGNLVQRESAISTICSYSHCTATFSSSELDVLCNFIREHLQ